MEATDLEKLLSCARQRLFPVASESQNEQNSQPLDF